MTDLTPLSPAALKVDRAIAACIQLLGEIAPSRQIAAAALEAAADQVVPADPCGDDCCITTSERIRADLLAIAAELRGGAAMTAIAQVERYAGQDFPCYGAHPRHLGVETVFSPFWFDGRRVHWGLPLLTRSDAITTAASMAGAAPLP